MPGCNVCEADNREEIETLALDAVRGEKSWRGVARELGISHHSGLKNHMDRHYTPEELQEAQGHIAEAIRSLEEEMSVASPGEKTLFLIVIQNLKGLAETKPSQDHAIKALKTLHEIRGMKLEQQRLLDYAKHFPKRVESTSKSVPELEAAGE